MGGRGGIRTVKGKEMLSSEGTDATPDLDCRTVPSYKNGRPDGLDICGSMRN